MLKFIILAIFASGITFAQLTDEELERLAKLRANDENPIDRITNSKFNKFTETQKEIIKIKMEDILQSPTFKGYINKGAILYNLVNQKKEKLTKNSYVNVYSLIDLEGFYYIKNENDQVTYKVFSEDVAHIEQITHLYDPPNYYKPTLETEVFNLRDNKLGIETSFNYQMGRTRPSFLRKLVNDPNHTGSLTRIEARTMGEFQLPIHMGLSLLYTNITAQYGNSGENYNQYSLAIGPIFEIEKIFERQFNFNLTFGFHSSIYSRMTKASLDDTIEYSLSQSMFTSGIEKIIKTKFGELMFGINYQRQWSKISSSQANINVKTNKNYDDNYALMIGWGTHWDIF